jgi:putative transposase
MFFLEFKAKGLATEYNAVDEAIRTAQFVRNESIVSFFGCIIEV